MIKPDKDYLRLLIRKEFDRLYKEKILFVDEKKGDALIRIAEINNLGENFIKELKNDMTHPF